MTEALLRGTARGAGGQVLGDGAARRPASGTPNRSGSAKRRRRGRRLLLWVVLVVIAVIMAAPFLWMLLTSVRSQEELYSADMSFWPQEWHWENFSTALNTAPFLVYAKNSFTIALVHTASNLILGSMCGYALAKLRFRGSTIVFAFILASMMIPFYAIVIPEFLMVRYVPFAGGNDMFGQGGSGWIDTWPALLVPALVSPFNIFLFRQFFVGTPTELIEAARIDGAGELRIFARIMAPLIRPGMLTVALLAFEQGWNNFLWPLIVTTSTNMRVIQVGLSVFRQEAGTQFNLLMAGTTMAAVPMIILFAIFQRHFVNGMVASGIK